MSDRNEPYSFHCTPCGKAHAGECPPLVNPCRAGTIGAGVIVKSPIINGVPTVGSRWVTQGKDVHGVWMPVKPGQRVYVVTRLGQGGKVYINDAAGHWGGDWEYDLEPWTDAGVIGSWRFVVAP